MVRAQQKCVESMNKYMDEWMECRDCYRAGGDFLAALFIYDLHNIKIYPHKLYDSIVVVYPGNCSQLQCCGDFLNVFF